MKILLTTHASQISALALILLSVTVMAANLPRGVNGQVVFDFNVNLNGYSLSVAPNHAGYVQVTVSLVSGSSQNVSLSATVSPQDGQVTASSAQSSGFPSFVTTLVVSALAAPPGKQYDIAVIGSAASLIRQAPALTLTISCPQGPCPQPQLIWTDKSAYAQGESIQFRGTSFYPGDSVASCLTTDDNVNAICRNQAAADNQGNVVGSMKVTRSFPPGPQKFYLKDLINGMVSPEWDLTILSPSATLTTSIVGQGTVAPSCPSGCSQTVGQIENVTAIPSSGWTFAGWNVTGASCSGGDNSNPCSFTMPAGPVQLTANFVQYQTLYTSSTGEGDVSPSCPTGCQELVGSLVSIAVTPADGWVISTFDLTHGVSCASQLGNTCSFTMPNFPVTFQVTFTETTITETTTLVTSSTIQTSTTGSSLTGATSTSTITTTTTSPIQTGTTETTVFYSTTSATTTETMSMLVTQFSTISTNVTSSNLSLENPTLELTLGGIILLSVLMMGVSIMRRSSGRGTVACAHCGFKNPSRTKFCVSCGERLKRP